MTPERKNRNAEIRKNVDRLVERGMTVEEALYHLKDTYGLQPDTIRKIYYDTNYESRYEDQKKNGVR